MSINVILATLGSSGDVNPFIDLGRAIVARGHRVTLVTHSHFVSALQEANLDFVALHSEEGGDYERITSDPDLWHPRRSLQVLAREIIVPGISPVYDAIEQLHIPGETIVVAHSLVFGARIVHETMSIPLVTVQLAPYSLRSVINSPRLPYDSATRWSGKLGTRVMYRIGDFLIDRVLRDPTNEFRQAYGLPPVQRLMKDWWLSPQRVVGLWPDWFCAPQPDWPECVRLTGFILHEMPPATDRDPAVESYFSEGEPPILFTPGTAMRHAHDFFVAAAEACRRMGRRGVLVTPHTEQIPSRLPDVVTHLSYVPFREYFARAAAVAHHGGIGTCAQAMLAGIPQIVLPSSYDQFDNGARLERLGVGQTLPPRRAKAHHLEKTLNHLLSSKQVATCCRSTAARMEANNSLETICKTIEDAFHDFSQPAKKAN